MEETRGQMRNKEINEGGCCFQVNLEVHCGNLIMRALFKTIIRPYYWSLLPLWVVGKI